ncbi:MAG: GNAT family N-acetyltransferase [Desulfobacterales bacterium]|nr:GNAT family N-acetyltransferase [Desulfobacterales bacterium]
MTSPDIINIRKITKADIPRAFDMIDRQEWYWTLNEVKRILELDPENSLVATIDDKIVGVITILQLNELAFLPHVVVEDKFRGNGLGKTLIEMILNTLDADGTKSIELFASCGVETMYEPFGFNKVETILYYSKILPGKVAPSAQDKENSFKIISITDPEVAALEQQVEFSLEQSLGGALLDTPSITIGNFSGDTLTDLMVLEKDDDWAEFGPWLMKKPDVETARKMIFFALSHLSPGIRLDFCFSSNNEVAKKLAETEDFKFELHLTRMARSKIPASPYPLNLMAMGKF